MKVICNDSSLLNILNSNGIKESASSAEQIRKALADQVGVVIKQENNCLVIKRVLLG